MSLPPDATRRSASPSASFGYTFCTCSAHPTVGTTVTAGCDIKQPCLQFSLTNLASLPNGRGEGTPVTVTIHHDGEHASYLEVPDPTRPVDDMTTRDSSTPGVDARTRHTVVGALDEMLKSFDRNDDNRLDQTERETLEKAIVKRYGAKWLKPVQTVLAEADANGDGVLVEREWTGYTERISTVRAKRPGTRTAYQWQKVQTEGSIALERPCPVWRRIPWSGHISSSPPS